MTYVRVAHTLQCFRSGFVYVGDATEKGSLACLDSVLMDTNALHIVHKAHSTMCFKKMATFKDLVATFWSDPSRGVKLMMERHKIEAGAARILDKPKAKTASEIKFSRATEHIETEDFVVDEEEE